MTNSVAKYTVRLLVFDLAVVIIKEFPLKNLFLFRGRIDINVHFLTEIFLCFVLFPNHVNWLLFLTIILQIFLSLLFLIKMWILIETFCFRYSVFFRFWFLNLLTAQMRRQIAYILIVTFQISYSLIKLSLTFVLHEFSTTAVAAISLQFLWKRGFFVRWRHQISLSI